MITIAGVSFRVGIDNISPGESTQPGAPGGMRMYLQALMTHMPESDPDATFTTLTPDWNADFGPLPSQISLKSLPGVPRSRVRRIIYQQTTLKRAIRQLHVDAWLATATVAPFDLGIPTVLVVQFLQFYDFPEAYGRARTAYLKWALPRSVAEARRVIVFTEFQREQLLARVRCDPARVVVVPHGVQHEQFDVPVTAADIAALDDLTGHRPFILYASATYGYKNHLGLIAAFAAMKRQRPDLPHCLLLAGSEQAVPFAALRTKAATLGVGADVIVAGRLPSLAAAYRRADVFAFPTLYETFGFPGLEAMACGCPVVASNQGAVAELAGDSAILADATQPEVFASALARVLDDKALRATLIEKGRRRAAAFTWKRTAAQTFTILRAAANE